MNKLGILLAVSSLPGRYGCGDFSMCKTFLKSLSKSQINIWQILPLNPIGYGHSPYQPFSSFAIDEMYIDVEDLYRKKLIKKPCKHLVNKKHSYFEKAQQLKKIYINEAFTNYVTKKGGYNHLISLIKSEKELYEYATFMANKENNNSLPWNEWSLVDNKKLEIEILKNFFAQIFLKEQWNSILILSRKLHISILGDVPFYVGYDSSDVYYNRNLFLLDDHYNPLLVAGVPPDYFSDEGQRWGNPIYNWEILRQTNYDFLIKRLEYASSLYDIIRLDHFRAFDSYWGINPTCQTAIDGKWYYPDGYSFFNCLYEKINNIDIIAEDLGDLRPEVITLKNHYNLPGMHVLQFSILDELRNGIAQIDTNNIYYTGTHDNDTLQGFISKLPQKDKKLISKQLSPLYPKKDLCDMMINFALCRKENVVIIPLQDLLKLNSKSRMNLPSTINTKNWTFRLADFKKTNERLHWLNRERELCIK
jgi:4-alpha-glucanotransferase